MLSDLSDIEIPLERLCIGKELGEGMIKLTIQQVNCACDITVIEI